MNYEPWYWLNRDSRTFLSRGYIPENQTAEERVQYCAANAEAILGVENFAEKFVDYMSRGWYTFSSPVWSNFGIDGLLPCSCNGSYIGDSIESILYSQAEVGMMTKLGAGTSAWFSALRGRGASISKGGSSFGAVHFMQLFETVKEVISQSDTRRGTFAAWYAIDGPDIAEFLETLEDDSPIHHLSIGVTVPDQWMLEMEAGDKDKQKIWRRIIRKRIERGYPYILFSDTVNDNKPQIYKDLGMTIHCSNVCSEILLPSSELESFVCNLCSINLLHWDEWKDTDAVQVLFWFLDAVLTEYISKTESIKFMERAHLFAKRHRAIGLGVLGWHSLLQSKMIPFESMEAKYLNNQIFKHIDDQTLIANQNLAARYGEPELLVGTGLRCTARCAIAPTTSSAFILGQVSQSIEPYDSNYYDKDLAKGRFGFKNPYLKEVLKSYKIDNRETWQSVLDHGGSVQHLSELSQNERDVFKTFGEISQKEIIIQAASRQKYVDQGQSLNLKIHPRTPFKEINELLMFAWKSGIKTLYYHKGTNPSQELRRNLINQCTSCEG